MKRSWKRNLLPLCTALLGGLGYALRSGLYAVGLDEKNLLVRGHPMETALWVCTAAAAAVILLAGWQQEKGSTGQFPGSLWAALGHLGAAAGILLTVLPLQPMAAPLLKAWRIAGIVCGPLLVWGAFSRATGKRPFFGIYGAVSIFFALYLIGHYQSWCADPQLQNYVFAFLGGLFGMVFSYQQAAMCTGNGSCRLQYLAALAALYCSLVTLSGTAYPLLYLGCGLWAGLSLCTAESHPKEKAGEDHAAS